MKPSDSEKKQWIAAIRKSGRFDREFYLRWYGDDPEIGRNLERHYVLAGESRGYWPCPGFCPAYYLEVNDDVAESGVSPFFHYVTRGEAEGRRLRPVPELQRAASGGLDYPPIRPPGSSVEKPRFAVVVHVFHYEMWPEFAERVRTLGDDCDLFVTITRRPGLDCDALAAEITREFPRAAVFPHPNHGRDIFPFIRLVNAGALNDYGAICKLHTKKSPHLETGTAWSDHLARSLLPGPGSSQQLARKFLSAKDCGILTADGQRKSGPQWWHENRGRTVNLLAHAGIPCDPERLCFPAGSMQRLKPAVIEALRRLRLREEDFEPELAQGDGTTAHAVERMLGYLSESRGLKVGEISEFSGQKITETDRQKLEFCELDESESDREGEIIDVAPPDPQLPPASRHVRYEGVIDSCSLRGVVGWIREVSDRDLPCRLLLEIDGKTITEGFADQYRADLGSRSDGHNWCGFCLPLPDGVFDGESHGFQITVLGEAWLWHSLTTQMRMPPGKETGEVSGVTGNEISGWCRDPLDPEFRQDVDLIIDGYFAGGTEPSADGQSEKTHEFRLEIPPSFRDGKTHDLKIVVRGSRLTLWEGTERLPA